MKKKRTTIKDIARELGVSIATISRALSKDQKVSALVTAETRKRVLQKAAELDYSPNLLALSANNLGNASDRAGILRGE